MAKLEKLTIRGFKSIAKLKKFELGDMNVLIGANGSGKSNFVDFFRMLGEMGNGGFQGYVARRGGDSLFHFGPQTTPNIETKLEFKNNFLEFELSPADDGSVYFGSETIGYQDYSTTTMGHKESVAYTDRNKRGYSGAAHGVPYYVHQALSSWKVYHFHDTSSTAPMRRECNIEDGWLGLQNSAENLPAFLWELKQDYRPHFDAIVKMIRRIAPYFEDFIFKPEIAPDTQRFALAWKQVGNSNRFSAQQFSDGTMRFICMVTALLQPNPPTTLVLDEPELGLHPEALGILASLMKSASERMQLIVATQSPVLLSEFDVEDVITVDQVDGASVFNRLDESGLEQWLDEYCLGDLWQKGIIRGGVNNG